MARVIAIMNQQAQVGKTVMTYNLGYALALMHQRVTLIDMDPAAKLTRSCNVVTQQGITQVLQDAKPLSQVSHSLATDFDLIPADSSLSERTEKMALKQGYKLRHMIDTMAEQDFILIDCPTEPGLPMLSALLAADEVIIPTTTSYLSAEGMVKSIQLFKQLKRLSGGAKLWLTMTQYDSASTPSKAIMTSIKAAFPKRVLATTVHYNSAVMQSQEQRKSVFDYQQTGQGANDFYSLAEDLLEGRVH